MTYVKQEWKNLPDQTTPLSAARLNHLETQFDEARAYINQTTVVSVLDFGADKTGDTDSTVGIQSALDSLSVNGGTLFFPPGHYLVRGYVTLPSNVRVTGTPGSVIVKDSSSVEPVFAALTASGGAKSNITIDTLRFQGALPQVGVNVFWGHLASGVLVSNVTVDGAVAGGHVLDLQGCNGVTVRDSIFRGSAAPEARGFTEAIQLDASVKSGAPVNAPGENYTGETTKNVHVSDCRFESYGSYRAPRPIGSHSAVQDRYYTGITFERNYMERPNVRTTGRLRAAINFIAVEDVYLRDNVFSVSGASDVTNLIQFHDAEEWVPLSGVNTGGAAVPATNPLKGLVLSVSGTSSDNPAIPLVSGNYTELPFSDSVNFGPYSSALPRVSVVDGLVNLDGVMKCNTAGFIEGSTNRVFASIPAKLRPARDQQHVRPGSGTATWTLEVRGDGSLGAARFNGTQPAGVWLPISVQWTRR